MKLQHKDAQDQKMKVVPENPPQEHIPDDELYFGEAERVAKLRRFVQSCQASCMVVGSPNYGTSRNLCATLF